MLGFSDLYSTFHYREFYPVFECVFISPLFFSRCLQNALCKCGHKNARTNIWKTEKRSPYQYFFTTFQMPLVISCRFIGKEITTSVPTRVRFTQMTGPNERVATALYQPLQSHHYSWSQSPQGLYPFIDLSHLFSFFSFLPDIHWMEEPYSVHVFTCIPHMFWNVHIMHFFLHNCILLYVHKTNQRSNSVNLSFVYLWNHFPVNFFFFFLFCVFLW